MKIKVLVLALAGLWLAGCGVLSEQQQAPGLVGENHPLNGKIWDVQGRRFVTQEQLAAQALQSDYLLLGETHDNPRHHQGQAWLLEQLRAGKRRAAVAFEMIDSQQGELIAGQRFDSSAQLIAELNKVQANWNYERFYRPLFDIALAAGYPIVPASQDRQTIIGIVREGEKHISPEIKVLLDATPLNAEQQAGSREEIKASHCGMLNDKMAAAMMLTQRVKDAVMAETLSKLAGVDSRVLVAGSGHARRDRGVPLYLARTAPDARVLAVGWLEVQPGVEEVAAYAGQWGNGRLPFDYVWFTPRVERPDPCASMRKHMHRKKTTEEQGDAKDD